MNKNPNENLTADTGRQTQDASYIGHLVTIERVVQVWPSVSTIKPHQADPAKAAHLRKIARLEKDAELGLYIVI